MMIVNSLRTEISISSISRTMDIPRSFIYYNRSEYHGKRKSRISVDIEKEILRIAEERTTYGYRRIWAMMRNKGLKVNKRR